MARKSKKFIEEQKKAAERLNEITTLREEAEKEELDILNTEQENLKKTCNEKGLFCGIIIKSKDLAAIVEMAFESTDGFIKIPAKFYFNE